MFSVDWAAPWLRPAPMAAPRDGALSPADTTSSRGEQNPPCASHHSAFSLAPPRPEAQTPSAPEPLYPPRRIDPSEEAGGPWQQWRERPLQTIAQHAVPLMGHVYAHARWAAVTGVKGADQAWQHALEPGLRAACAHGKRTVVPVLQEQGRMMYGRGIHQVGLISQTWLNPMHFAAGPPIGAELRWAPYAYERHERSLLPDGDWVVQDLD